MNKYCEAEDLHLIFSGDDFFEELGKLIDSSREVLHVQTYILEEDETGKRVVGKLKAASARGVSVYILVDAFGSKSLSWEFINQLKESGIRFRMFSPFFSTESVYLGRRLHHKIAVADRRLGIIGGINIADKYHGTKEEKAWLDYALLVKGEVCGYLHDLCENMYLRKNFRREKKIPFAPPGSTRVVRFRRNDWIKGKNEIHKSYREALVGAQTSIDIVCSYFLPGFAFRRLLKKARKRGVRINILLAGKSDLPWLKKAEKYLYGFFLRHDIHIYEWPTSVLHAKAVMVDREWLTIGSYNLNHLSHYRSIELNADTKDPGVISAFSAHLDTIIGRECLEVTRETIPTGWWENVQISLSYYYYRTLMSLFIPKRKAVFREGRRGG
jgi:cardiolipin synthase A/B